MITSKHLLVGAGLAVFATVLVSFSNGDDTGKKKKYHVIHQKDGNLQEFDTILPMNSDYNVEDFLAEKGIENADVQILKIPSAADQGMVFIGNEGSQNIMMHKIDHDVTISDEDGEHKEVKIIREDDGNGTVIMKKFVNGKEVALSEEELNSSDHKEKKKINVIHVEDGNQKSWTPTEGETIEIKVEIDDKGALTVQKFVNGEEVEVSEEEMSMIQENQENGGMHEVIIVDELDGDMDSIFQELDIEIVEETVEDGQQRIIIREFHEESEESIEDSGELKKEIQFHTKVDVDGEEEDFTIVLITENFDENEVNQTTTNTQRMALNEPISVYPNPNNGTFTIAFSQEEKVKTSIEIVDVQGKVVFKEKLGSFSGAYKKELDLKKYGVGVYIVNVQQGDEVSARKVIVE